MLTALAEAPGILVARMSGSGATCFGLTGAVEEAKSAAESLRLRHPGWWITASRILPDAALPDSAKVR